MQRIAIGFFATLMTAGFALAAEPTATLDVLQGLALIDTGAGFVAAGQEPRLKSGDRVMLLSGAAAVLASAETGCVIAMRAPGTFTVPNLNGCLAGHAQIIGTPAKIEPANGTYVLVAPPPPPPLLLAPEVAAESLTPMLVGLTVAGASFALAGFITVTDNEKPASGY
jgi:hypothetical protein